MDLKKKSFLSRLFCTMDNIQLFKLLLDVQKNCNFLFVHSKKKCKIKVDIIKVVWQVVTSLKHTCFLSLHFIGYNKQNYWLYKKKLFKHKIFLITLMRSVNQCSAIKIIEQTSWRLISKQGCLSLYLDFE